MAPYIPKGWGFTAPFDKKLILSFTTGASAEEYRRGAAMNYKVEDFMVPFQQTANLCGLKLLPPVYSNGMMYVEGLSTADDLQIIEKKAREHAQRLFTLISTLN